MRFLPIRQAGRQRALAEHTHLQVNDCRRRINGAMRPMQTHVIGSRSITGSQSLPRSNILAAALMAALLGGLVIWAVGFSPIDVAHNAAHDTRHSIGFPCH
jgi:cobalt transporter subunit CbtB